ncbi:MAG: hypothetical protein LAP40_17310 [Acidobacteriia bacterium]|nr:hypothetical protein [Terriglobia bacterium]
MTNETIIKMVQSGVPTETIVRTIQSAESFRFGTLPGDLSQLQQAKVPDEVIRALAARINWPGSSPLVIAHPPLTPQSPLAVPPPPGSNSALKKGAFPSQSQDQEDPYLFKGAREISFVGSGFVTGGSSKNTNLAGITAGTFLSAGNLLSAGILTSGVHDLYLAGLYRHFFKTKDPKLFPFGGIGAGSNLAHLSDSTTNHNYLARGELGLRYFPVRHIAVDMAYTLQYLHMRGSSFGDSAASGVTFGFIHVF